MSTVVIADAFGLVSLYRSTPSSERVAMLASLTRSIEQKRLCFPREVADELAVLEREGKLAGWAIGLGGHLDAFKSDVAFTRPLMAHVQAAGFPEGFEALDNKDPAIVHVGRLASEYASSGVDFVILSTDTGELPLRPTMKQICKMAGWRRVKPKACKAILGL